MKAFFNGVELTDRFILSDLSRPIPGNDVETLNVPGMDGILLKSAKLAAGSVSFTLWPHWMTKRELRAAVREIAVLMAVAEPAPLAFSDDDGLYYMAVPSGGMGVRELEDAFAVDCSFTVPSPAMYGGERSVTVPSGGSASFRVGGTYPTKAVVTAPSAVRGAGGYWSLRLDGGMFSKLSIPTSAASAVEIDSVNRTAKVAGALSLMTLDSDWLELGPGAHVLSNDIGGGACTVRWIERWL